MWPLTLDMTRDECRGILRRSGKYERKKNAREKQFACSWNLCTVFILEAKCICLENGINYGCWWFPTELETYSSVVSTFRAQGGLSEAKVRMLRELREVLHISQERHKAEARRVANDERLCTVAEL